jgi:hypothetical protein
MLDSILKSGGAELVAQLGKKFNLDAVQGGKVIDVAKDTLQKNLLSEVTSGNFDGVLSMLNGSSSGAGSALTGKLTDSLVSGLMSKVGIKNELAKNVAQFIIPFVMQKLSGQKPAGGFTQGNIMDMIQGAAAGSIKDKAADLLKGGLGKLFK